jgi:hypothetical protein
MISSTRDSRPETLKRTHHTQKDEKEKEKKKKKQRSGWVLDQVASNFRLHLASCHSSASSKIILDLRGCQEFKS